MSQTNLLLARQFKDVYKISVCLHAGAFHRPITAQRFAPES